MKRRERVSILLSLSPLFYLLGFVILFRFVFTTDPLYGSHQLSLFLAGLLALLQRFRKHHIYSLLRHSLWRNFLSVLPAMLILFFVGMLIGAWANAGILGSMIFLGTKLLYAPTFLPGVAILCGITAVISGSSWTTAGTLGVALMGVGNLFGFSPEICAGAIVSGCYFGDKLSPLSDTTNLASSLTGVPLGTHIRYMMKTTIPSFALCLIAYGLWNFFDPPSLGLQNNHLDQFFSKEYLWFQPLHMIPVILVFGSAIFGLKAVYSLSLGILSSLLLAYLSGAPLTEMGRSLLFGYYPQTGNANLDALLGGGGILAILPTEILIITAVWFGGILEGMGYLSEILTMMKRWIYVKWDVLLASMGSSFILNLTTADQYLSLVVPARAFRHLAEEYQIEGREVSRSLEDSGTISSPLIPWNSCGAFMATSLKISTFAYLPFAWFNLFHIALATCLLFYRKSKK